MPERIRTGRGRLRPAAGLAIPVTSTAKQRNDGFAVEARASLTIDFHERPPDQKGIFEHQVDRALRIKFSGNDLAGLAARRD